jgi:hypothetical protein
MRVKLSQLIASIFLIFVISQFNSFSNIHTCKCEFDTGEYEATGYFAGTCSYTMNETRKKCELRRAEDYQDIRRSLIREDVFGDPMELKSRILPSALELYFNPNALMDLDPIYFFSFMMRSSYLAAPFLNNEEKIIIDDLLLNILKRHGQDMLSIFVGLHEEVEKIFQEESTIMNVKKGTAKLTVNIYEKSILICAKVLPQIKD